MAAWALHGLDAASLATSDACIVGVRPRAPAGFPLHGCGESGPHPGSVTLTWWDGQEGTHPFRETVPRVARRRDDVSVLGNEAEGGLPSCSCGPQGARERRRQRAVLMELAYPAQASAQEEGRGTWPRASAGRGPGLHFRGPFRVQDGSVCFLVSLHSEDVGGWGPRALCPHGTGALIPAHCSSWFSSLCLVVPTEPPHCPPS